MTAADDFDFRTAAPADRLILRRQVLAHGGTDADLRNGIRDGSLERIRWGGYARTGAFDDEPDAYARRDARYRTMIHAAVRVGGDRRYLSHQSAAALLAIPLLHLDTTTVHFTSEHTGRTSPGQVIHQAHVPTADLVEVDGLLVTSIGRTVCDVARSGTLREAICALDSGLYQARLRREPIDLAATVDGMRRQHGIATLRTALPHATDRAESIGESLSSCVFIESTIPRPELQALVRVADGSVKRCDFGWRDARGRLAVVGEFDGRFKYHRQSAVGGPRPAEEVIYAEKLREDAIRECDIIVIRWTWTDLQNPAALITRIRTALRRAGIIR